jgi:hypothetical protein
MPFTQALFITLVIRSNGSVQKLSLSAKILLAYHQVKAYVTFQSPPAHTSKDILPIISKLSRVET